MNSRQFETRALLQAHKTVLEKFFIESDTTEIDQETADHLAEAASLLSHRLTIEWELLMRWCQRNDDNPDSDAHRENSLADLDKSFMPGELNIPQQNGLN
jgi:hypothetical protein